MAFSKVSRRNFPKSGLLVAVFPPGPVQWFRLFPPPGSRHLSKPGFFLPQCPVELLLLSAGPNPDFLRASLFVLVMFFPDFFESLIFLKGSISLWNLMGPLTLASVSSSCCLPPPLARPHDSFPSADRFTRLFVTWRVAWRLQKNFSGFRRRIVFPDNGFHGTELSFFPFSDSLLFFLSLTFVSSFHLICIKIEPSLLF